MVLELRKSIALQAMRQSSTGALAPTGQVPPPAATSSVREQPMAGTREVSVVDMERPVATVTSAAIMAQMEPSATQVMASAVERMGEGRRKDDTSAMRTANMAQPDATLPLQSETEVPEARWVVGDVSTASSDVMMIGQGSTSALSASATIREAMSIGAL